MATPMIATIATGAATPKKTRSMNIREVDNGYVIRCEVCNPHPEPGASNYMDTELVNLTLPQLLKTVKAFFEPEITEEGGE